MDYFFLVFYVDILGNVIDNLLEHGKPAQQKGPKKGIMWSHSYFQYLIPGSILQITLGSSMLCNIFYQVW